MPEPAAIKKFGIKEVADVEFYNVTDFKLEEVVADKNQTTAQPVLKFDSLKVSNLEFTGEQAEARGGKGNSPLIIWDYGREVNVTLEDALVSMESLEIMFGAKNTAGTGTHEIVISADTFPGTYAIVGSTYARDTDGKDHVFKFVIPKAKVQSENTITMEAEGDPSVFNLSLKVLRGDDDAHTMVKLICVDKDTSAKE